jgi:uncharacterized protein
VALISTLLALRRSLDPELIAIAAMLHDISSYKTGDPANHAHLSALEAVRILTEIGEFTQDEIRSVSNMIEFHSAKDRTDDLAAEVLKDADVLQHYLYNPAMTTISRAEHRHAEARQARIMRIRKELSLA